MGMNFVQKEFSLGFKVGDGWQFIWIPDLTVFTAERIFLHFIKVP